MRWKLCSWWEGVWIPTAAPMARGDGLGMGLDGDGREGGTSLQFSLAFLAG